MANNSITIRPNISTRAEKYDFLAGGGEMGKLMRSNDWSKTAVGEINTWPQSLRTSVSIILNSAFPMFIWWGKDELTNFYNDAYKDILGEKHPNALGWSGKIVWAEIWHDVGPLAEKVFATGEAIFMKDLPLTIVRFGHEEKTYFTFSYSAIRNEAGQIAGVYCACVETTQQILAQETLQAEQSRLRDLFMNAPAAIAILSGPELIFKLANAPYHQLVGIDRPLDGMPLLEAIPDLEPSLLKIVQDGAFKGKRFTANELPVLIDWDSSGKPFTKYLNFIYEPVYENSKPNGLATFVFDVTEQVKARTIVENQNSVLEMITSGAPLSEALTFLIKSVEGQSDNEMIGSILLLDEDGKHLRHGAAPSLPKAYNEAIDGITIGATAGSCGTAAFTKKTVIVSDIASDPIWEDYRDLAIKHNLGACWSTPLLSGKKVLGTFALYYHAPHTPTEEDKKIIQFTIKTATLAIERKRTEVALQQQLEVTKAITDIATACLFMIDDNGIVTFMNASAQQVTGYKPSDAIGKPMHSLVHHSHPDGSEYPEAECPLVNTYKHGKPNPLHEDIFFRKDGSPFNALITGTPIPGKNGLRSTVVEFRDITEEKIAQQNQQRLIVMTEQRNALAKLNKTKDEFIALASHQLRTPATAVKQYIGLLLNDLAGPVPTNQIQYLQTAYDSNERQLNIINDLLKTAQLDSNKYDLDKKPHDLLELVHESLAGLRPAYEMRSQTVTINSIDKIVRANVDSTEIKLVFVNLLENASKYSYPNTEIKINVLKKNKVVKIAFTDKGVGVSKDNQGRIFDKFTRINNELSDTVSGTGLGLYWVKQIVELHKGSIKLVSSPKKGSTFTVTLPL